MSKKLIFGLIVFTAIIIGIIIYLSRFPGKTISPVSNKKLSPTSAAKKLKEYTDPSGFKFSYPEDVTLKAKDISTSKDLYADITIASIDRKGQITLQVQDTTKTFFDEGLKDKTTIETTLDDIPAFEYQEKNQLVTTAYDQGVLFTFTTDFANDRNYWFGIKKQILNSFQFVEPQTPAESNQSQDADEGDIIFEGEETIE